MSQILPFAIILVLGFSLSCRENQPGETVPPAQAQISLCASEALDFGSTFTGSSRDQIITFENTGNGSLVFSGAVILPPFTFKDNSFPGTGGTCTTQLNPGQSCTIVLSFTPFAATSYDQTVSVDYTSLAGTSTTSCRFLGTGLQRYGLLDTSFHTDGIFATTFTDGQEGVYGLGLQTDGRILMVGSAAVLGSDNVAILRLRTDGSLDPSFGTNGKVVTPDGIGFAILQDGNGSLVTASTSLAYDVQLTRYRSDGTLDTSFGTMGQTTTSFSGGIDNSRQLVLLSDGKLLSAGTSFLYGWQGSYAFARFLTDGSLDTSFNTEGKTVFSAGDDMELMAIARQSDDRVVATGWMLDGAGIRYLIMRLDTDGLLDTSFNTTGVLIGSFYSYDVPYGIVAQTDGRIVVGGYLADDESKYRVFTLRVLSDGSLDTSFHTTGRHTVRLFEEGGIGVNDIRLQTNGQIVMGLQIPFNTGYNFAVLRWTTDGQIDSSFGTNGVAVTTLGGTANANGSVLVTPHGIVRGATHLDGSSTVFGMARFTIN